MFSNHSSSQQRAISWIVTLCTVLVSLLPASIVQAAPLATAPVEATVVTTTTLVAVEDQGMIESAPNFIAGGAPYFVLNGRPDTHSEDLNFIQFDLSAIPADATIVGAQLKLGVFSFGGPARQLEVGRANGGWEEGVTSWSTMPPVIFNGNVQTVTERSEVTWPLKPLVEAWHNGTLTNNGVAVSSLDNGNNAGVQARTKDGVCLDQDQDGACDYAFDLPPRLVIAYTLPADDGQPHPDLGDAPDSTNHHGQNNTAYPSGVLGQFPTVYDVPANQPAGPLHRNVKMEGWLGDFLSREGEADLGPDQDSPRNNILRNTVTGNVADVADNDRGDDGWRNRNLRFFNCDRTQLEMRVSKSPTATLNFMYLNVWFDGNRDGDWSDLGQCQADADQPAQASYEWIVQNYIVDMTSIPAGGSRDFNVLTEKVLNSSGVGRHWMRFTLSEAPATQPFSGTDLPDGRGPHPQSPTLKAFQYGETEDVLQRSAPLGEDGTLQIQKRVITDGEPVEWIDYVTYEITLRHDGGTQPMQARMRDVLPYPLIVYPTIDGGAIRYVTVESPTGGATPLQAQLEVLPPSGSTPPQQVIKWQGSLAPDAVIKFTFQVRVLALCDPNQQTIDFTNTAQARPQGGTIISASDTFSAKCIDYDESNIDLDLEPIINTVDLDDVIHVPVSGTIHNLHPVTVSLGIYQNLVTGTVQSAELDKSTPLLDLITLAPNESKPLAENLTVNAPFAKSLDELSLPDDYAIDLGLNFCIIPPGQDNCPDANQFPNLHGHIPFTLTVRPNDLGDAPDSSNHTLGAAGDMPAYPNGTLGNFPTVFDPATGQPQGPRHNFPGPFHLGQFVSREAEADVPPDQDPLLNIRPVADDPDNDRADDGTNLALWNLNNCQTTNLPVQVAIRPAAVAYFQQLGSPAYLNIWIDSNRDGDWADAAQCGQNPAPEHIVIDFPVNVVGLGVGLQTINVPTALVPWQTTDKPAWVRITLSERPSNKTLQAGNVQYGDGRGYANPFKTGETEDYYYRPLSAGGGPDLAVQMNATSRQVTADEAGLQAAAGEKLGNFEIQLFKIHYQNIGASAVLSGLLEFQIPEQFHGLQPVVANSDRTSTESISFNFDRLTLVLPHLEQNERGTVILGWYGCYTCTLASSVTDTNIDYAANVKATVVGDVDESNNSASATARGLLSSPIIGGFMDYTDDACMDRILHGPIVTNKTSFELRGKAQPNRIIAILIGLLKVAEVPSDANGNFSYLYTANPSGGLLGFHAKYVDQVGSGEASIISPRDAASGLPTGQVIVKVDPSLPFDPMSVCFVDSHNRSYALPTLGYSFGATQTGGWLRSGETYTVSVNSKTGAINQYFKVTFEDVLLSSLLDNDGDGTYTGVVTFPINVSAASVSASGKLGLIVGGETGESSFSMQTGTASDGVISSRTSAQPVANATVSVLIGQDSSEGLAYELWAANEAGQSNPQITGSDGKYSYSANTGLYRINVTAPGYQAYRSQTTDASSDSLTPNIALSPAINEAATQTIYITDNGYQPALVTVAPGSVVEFVNLDVDEHASAGNTWDSGLLASGQRYKVKLSDLGSYNYSDSANPLNQGTIAVAEEVVATNSLFLPLVSR